MNFFAHATVALWRSNDPRFVLGSMLPDLAGMLGMRLPALGDPVLRTGVEFHHATDAAFHACPVFVDSCSHAIEALGAVGISRGSARAVGHVGFELLLDGILSDDARAVQAYATALGCVSRPQLTQLLPPERREWAARLHDGLRRLAKAPVPQRYRDPDFVVDRLNNVLARRPRLALAEVELPEVARFIRAAQPQVERGWPELRDELHARLR